MRKPQAIPPSTADEQLPQLAPELQLLADWMDGVFRVPGVGWRFGLDAILGFIPGIGDTATSVASLYILTAAHRYGVTRTTLLRMALNVVLDAVVGAIPLIGDIFDVYWKSNQRNVAILKRHMLAVPAEQRHLQRADRWFVVLLVTVLALLLIGSVIVAAMLLTWLIRTLAQAF
ncbi:DUF4112 domain-containing protein [Lacipirellula parvula]|uniref:DUF4112 domain-containing protein n=1 Tax=Lacipirellula parvula TaxID=2650471 RepID=A0A5K7XE14_9BACT|nr:DUF4112 domain-containing protein [Lacipirellula parvula]BBO33101.1 hypothetical protein PLANPX_2713 [Lacipirellula parvula]